MEIAPPFDAGEPDLPVDPDAGDATPPADLDPSDADVFEGGDEGALLLEDDGVEAPVIYGDGPVGPVAEPSLAPPAPDAVQVIDEGKLVGDPTSLAPDWFEEAANGYCPPAGISALISAYTVDPMWSEEEFIGVGNDLGVFEEDDLGAPRVPPEGVVAVLETEGITASLVLGGSLDLLLEYADEGRSVMVFVDSEQGHAEALVVTGADAAGGVVHLEDPATADGGTFEVSWEYFETAWHEASDVAVVCDEPATGGASLDDGADAEPGDAPQFASANAGAVGDPSPGPLAATVEFVAHNKWVLIPVALGAREVVAHLSRTD